MESSLSAFSFCYSYLGVIPKNHLPNHKLWIFTPIFSSKSFMLLVLYLGHWSISVYFAIWCEVGIQLHSFICGNPAVSAHSPLNGLGTVVKNHLAINVWVYFWTLNSIPLVCMSVFMPVPHCVDYYTFVISFEIRNFQDDLAPLISISMLKLTFCFCKKYVFGFW